MRIHVGLITLLAMAIVSPQVVWAGQIIGGGDSSGTSDTVRLSKESLAQRALKGVLAARAHREIYPPDRYVVASDESGEFSIAIFRKPSWKEQDDYLKERVRYYKLKTGPRPVLEGYRILWAATSSGSCIMPQNIAEPGRPYVKGTLDPDLFATIVQCAADLSELASDPTLNYPQFFHDEMLTLKGRLKGQLLSADISVRDLRNALDGSPYSDTFEISETHSIYRQLFADLYGLLQEARNTLKDPTPVPDSERFYPIMIPLGDREPLKVKPSWN